MICPHCNKTVKHNKGSVNPINVICPKCGRKFMKTEFVYD